MNIKLIVSHTDSCRTTRLDSSSDVKTLTTIVQEMQK